MALTASLTLALVLSTTAMSETDPAPPSAPASAPVTVTSDAWKYDLPERRPAALPALYASLAAINALDVYSTRRAIGAGAYEANPLMRQTAGNTGAMLAVKAAATVSTIYFTERTWKKNRKVAVILAAAINGATAAVVARNLRNARR